MPIRMNAATLLLTLLFALAAPAIAAEKIYHIRAGATVDHAAGVYPDLETLRLAFANGEAYLDNGSVIMLYNDDRSMGQGIVILPGTDVTVKSAGGGSYKIWNKNGMAWRGPFYATSGDTFVHFENIVIDMTATSGGGSSPIFTGESGTLTVSNSVLTTNYDDSITFSGTADIAITNSILNGSNYYWGGIIAQGAGSTLDILFDSNAQNVSTWTKSSFVNGSINVDVAGGKKFDQQGLVTAATITKTGAGVWKVYGGSAGRLTIDQGTLFLGNGRNYPVYDYDENGNIKQDNDGNDIILRWVTWQGNSIHVGKEGVLKVTWHPGNVEEFYTSGKTNYDLRTDRMTTFDVDYLFSEEGARTEIGLISLHPTSPIKQENSNTIWTYGLYSIYVGVGNVENTTIASTMNIDNRLLKATWSSGLSSETNLTTSKNVDVELKDSWFLHIEELNNLGILDGLGSFADVYRMMDLTDDERDMLDTIYCSGAASGSQLGFLQTLGGYHIQNTLLAMRHNQANMLQKVNRRVTGYQKDDLYDLSVKGGDVCDYSDWDACTDGGEMWAFMEQTWMSQNDVDSLAGYRYQTHTLGLGYDWHTGALIYGGVLNYSAGKMKLRNNYGSYTDIDQLLGTLYLSYAQDGYYLTGAAMAGYGWNDSTSRYSMTTIDVTAKTGTYSTSMYGASVEGGYMWETEFAGAPLRVTPYGSLTYARIHRGSARETGGEFAGTSMNRHFDGTNWHMGEFAVGARVAMPLERDGYTLIPSADIAYTRMMGTLNTTGGHARFIDRDPSAWNIPITGANRSAVRMSANLDARIKQNLTVGAGYEFEWRRRYWKHQLNVGMTLGF